MKWSPPITFERLGIFQLSKVLETDNARLAFVAQTATFSSFSPEFQIPNGEIHFGSSEHVWNLVKNFVISLPRLWACLQNLHFANCITHSNTNFPSSSPRLFFLSSFCFAFFILNYLQFSEASSSLYCFSLSFLPVSSPFSFDVIVFRSCWCRLGAFKYLISCSEFEVKS